MSAKSTTTNYDLSTLRSKLRAGEVSKISSLTGYSESHVSNVLAGRRNNSDILKTASKMVARRK